MTEGEIELNGRKYKALMSSDSQTGAYVIIGPPEGLVDELELPEPFATRFHNILFTRGIFKYNDAVRGKALQGALQEALSLDIQRVVEKFSEFEKEST